MTRDEAIEILRCRKDGDAAEALEVVLKVAEAQPCENCEKVRERIEKTREEIAILIEQLEDRNLSDQLIGAIKVCSIFCRNLKKEDDDELQ